MNSARCRRIGFWWSEKKGKKINSNELADVCRASGYELIRLDLDQPFELQGPFAAIVHKLSDVIVKAKGGDLKSQNICEAFQKYVDSHPKMVILDPLPKIDKVLGRYTQYETVVNSSRIQQEGDIFIPAFVELTTMSVAENLNKMKAAGVEFPIVCKPLMAHGSTRSHQMSIIFNEDGLRDISLPCVVQKFINHNAVLFKIFILGNDYFVIERPSLKNFFAGDHKTIYFDSNKVSKPDSTSELTELDDNEPYTPVVWPEKRKMDCIVQAVQESLGLNLMGIDVVICNKTGHYAIIDMNVFPGYSEAENFYHMLTNLIIHKIQMKESGFVDEPAHPNLIDHLSTPVLKVKEDKQQFNFDFFRYCSKSQPGDSNPQQNGCFGRPNACSNGAQCSTPGQNCQQ